MVSQRVQLQDHKEVLGVVDDYNAIVMKVCRWEFIQLSQQSLTSAFRKFLNDSIIVN